jgi:hypothetical protein
MLTLLDLPTEIKAHIVHHARLQDVAYNQRCDLPRPGPCEDSLDAWVANSNGWYGRSCNALFMVNRELSGLCAEELFKASPLGVF